jgi:hypothetical protein
MKLKANLISFNQDERMAINPSQPDVQQERARSQPQAAEPTGYRSYAAERATDMKDREPEARPGMRGAPQQDPNEWIRNDAAKPFQDGPNRGPRNEKYDNMVKSKLVKAQENNQQARSQAADSDPRQKVNKGAPGTQPKVGGVSLTGGGGGGGMRWASESHKGEGHASESPKGIKHYTM